MTLSQAEARIEPDALERYLHRRAGAPVQIEELRQLRGDATGPDALKQFGYGRPLLVHYRIDSREVREVLHRIRHNAFGREREDDRAAAVWLDFRTFNRLPRHVPALDMVVLDQDGEMHSICQARELLLTTAFRPGELYANDLLRIRDEGSAEPLDLGRAAALAAYLATIHGVEHEAHDGHDGPRLWRRRLRDLVGHGEGIMGLADSYPADLPYVTPVELREIEEAANRWRWRLKPLTHRLRQVHGDFHPFNLLFEEGTRFHVLDRSRGEWGEPADDVSCMAINYFFFSLQRSGALEGAFRTLHDLFWEQYLDDRRDDGLPSAIQPWFAWRALVLASPIWYPTIDDDVRRKLIAFARRVLSEERYDYHRVNDYLEGV